MSLQVSPEIEAKIRQVAAARGVPVDSLFDEALLIAINRLEVPLAQTPSALQDSSREMTWIAKPHRAFVNQWVALDGDNVVAHGSDGKAVYESARAQGVTSPFLHFVQERNDTPFVGGWL